MSLSLVLRQDVAQRLSQEQRLEQTLTVRIALIQALQGDEYRPTAVCPACTRQMSAVEILQGFNRDPADFTTACSGCGHRFAPKLKTRGGYGSMEVALYCDMQTQAQLKGFEHLEPHEFRVKHAALFHSAVFHNGSLRAAFVRLDIKYEFEETVDALAKALPFIGKLPDTELARIIGYPVREVRKIRHIAKIPVYHSSRSH